MREPLPAVSLPQSVRTLRFALLEGVASVEPLRILDSLAFRWGDWRVGVYALATSHALTFACGERAWTELLSCARLPDAGRILLESATDAPARFAFANDAFAYSIVLAPFALEEGERLQGDFAPDCRLAVAYPAMPGLPTPHTYLGWRVASDVLEVETVHTYPEEGQGVRSRTRLQTIPPAP